MKSPMKANKLINAGVKVHFVPTRYLRSKIFRWYWKLWKKQRGKKLRFDE